MYEENKVRFLKKFKQIAKSEAFVQLDLENVYIPEAGFALHCT